MNRSVHRYLHGDEASDKLQYPTNRGLQSHQFNQIQWRTPLLLCPHLTQVQRFCPHVRWNGGRNKRIQITPGPKNAHLCNRDYGCPPLQYEIDELSGCTWKPSIHEQNVLSLDHVPHALQACSSYFYLRRGTSTQIYMSIWSFLLLGINGFFSNVEAREALEHTLLRPLSS